MNVFLTGATGLIGGELAVHLAQRSEVASVRCLVRSKGGHSGLTRLRAVFAFHGQVLPHGKVSAIEGDLSDARLAQSLAEDTTLGATNAVVNAAANTSFLPQNADAVEEVNVRGLQRLLAWSETLPELATFLQVSTAAICGANRTHSLIREDESPDPRAPQLVAYTASKLRAELLVRASVPDSRLVIARPSIVMGHSLGRRPRSPVVLWAMAAMNRLRLVPATDDAPLDVIPVDHAVEAIARLLVAPRRRQGVYHVSSGAAAATNPAELARLLERGFPELPEFRFVSSVLSAKLRGFILGRDSTPLQFQGFEHYRDFWRSSIGGPRRVLALLAALAPYFRFMEQGQIFDNTRLAEDTGLQPSEPAHVYLSRNLAYVADIDVLGEARDP